MKEPEVVSETELEALFLQEGYERTGRLQYKASFSNNEVRHYVEMERSIQDPRNFPGRIRIGNDEISSLSAGVWSAFSGTQTVPFDSISQIFLNIDTQGKHTSSGALRSEPRDNISHFLREQVTILMQPINSLDALYRVTLHGNETPFRWLGVTSAKRSLQALVLAKRMSVAFAEVSATLELRRSSIERSLSGQSADSFFNFVWSNTP
jgi:hypothetical protein